MSAVTFLAERRVCTECRRLVEVLSLPPGDGPVLAVGSLDSSWRSEAAGLPVRVRETRAPVWFVCSACLFPDSLHPAPPASSVPDVMFPIPLRVLREMDLPQQPKRARRDHGLYR